MAHVHLNVLQVQLFPMMPQENVICVHQYVQHVQEISIIACLAVQMLHFTTVHAH